MCHLLNGFCAIWCEVAIQLEVPPRFGACGYQDLQVTLEGDARGAQEVAVGC